MGTDLTIKYTEVSNNETGYDLGLLGESFAGFNEVFKELFQISKINGELDFRTKSITAGSIDVNNIVAVITSIPFSEIQDFLNFLQVVDDNLYRTAVEYFNAFGNGHKTVNDYFRENGFDSNIVSAVLASFLTKMFEWGGKQKNVLTLEIQDKKIPVNYAKQLQSMVKKGKYKRALNPISQNNIASIALITPQSHQVAQVDETTLSEYLPDEEQILPDLVNGSVHNFTGQILAMQSTRGDNLRFKVFEIDPRFQLLTAYPGDGKKTEDYKDFYKKHVEVKVEVFRKTLFKKPELLIREISVLQQNLFEDPKE